MTEKFSHYQRSQKIKHLKLLIILTVIGLIGYNLLIKHGFYGVGGDFVDYTPKGIFILSLYTYFLSFPILALIIGLFVSFLPYKKLSYGKKYFRAAVLSLITIESFFIFLLIGILVMTVVGTYPPKVSQEEILKNKEQYVAEYKHCMQPLIDSSIVYLDRMIIEKSIDNAENQDYNRLQFNDYQDQMAQKAEEFREFAEEYDLSMDEYMEVLSYWEVQSEELLFKGKYLERLVLEQSENNTP